MLEGRFVVGDWTPTFLSGESSSSGANDGVQAPTTNRKRGQPDQAEKNGKLVINYAYLQLTFNSIAAPKRKAQPKTASM